MACGRYLVFWVLGPLGLGLWVRILEPLRIPEPMRILEHRLLYGIAL